MEDMSILSEIALLAKEGKWMSAARRLLPERSFRTYLTRLELEEQTSSITNSDDDRDEVLVMLDDWDGTEEELEKEKEVPDVALNDIIYFRQAHLAMETDYPFSASFGIASTRRTCVNSAIRLYNKLLKLQNDGDVLRFATIAEVAMLNAKSADSQKMRHMLQVFRPDKDEVVTLVDFAGAVDNVYKKLTLLKRSIENAAAIDRAYEHMINAGFFTVVFVIVLAALGIDPLAFILALSSLIVSFAFMIGSAASNYFEGILLILLRRPYEIGDRIAVSAVDDPAETDGSAGWIVENIDLYTTTVRLAATREVATVSNGSLARSRIINMKRSEKALLTIFLRFSVDTPFEKIVILKNAVEVYVKERPQVRRQRIVVREPNDCFF